MPAADTHRRGSRPKRPQGSFFSRADSPGGDSPASARLYLDAGELLNAHCGAAARPDSSGRYRRVNLPGEESATGPFMKMCRDYRGA